MPDITITLSESQYKALESEVSSMDEWVSNIAISRANQAIEQIVRDYTDRAFAEGIQMPSTKDELILDAYERGWVKTAAVKGAEFTAALLAKHGE